MPRYPLNMTSRKDARFRERVKCAKAAIQSGPCNPIPYKGDCKECPEWCLRIEIDRKDYPEGALGHIAYLNSKRAIRATRAREWLAANGIKEGKNG